MNAARRLIANHLPFTVITAEQIGHLARYKVLILSNVHHLSPEEAGAIREYVRQGGALYASGGTSLVTTSGQRQTDFQLADVFGVSLVKADWSDASTTSRRRRAARQTSPTGSRSTAAGEGLWLRGARPARRGSTRHDHTALACARSDTVLLIHSNPPGCPPTIPKSCSTGSARDASCTAPACSRRWKACRRSSSACCAGSSPRTPSRPRPPRRRADALPSARPTAAPALPRQLPARPAQPPGGRH